MKNQTKFLVFVGIGILLLFVPHTSQGYFYQQGIASTGAYTAIIKPNKSSYSAGEPIVISGEVKPYDKTRDLQITIMDSSKKILVLQTVSVSSDASFSLTITDMANWKKDTYTVLAQYGVTDVEVGMTKFSFDPTMTTSDLGTKTDSDKSKEKTTKKSDVKKKPAKIKSEKIKKTKPAKSSSDKMKAGSELKGTK